MPSLSFLFLPPNYKIGQGTTAGASATFDDALVLFDHTGLDFEGLGYPDPPRTYPLPVGHNSLVEV